MGIFAFSSALLLAARAQIWPGAPLPDAFAAGMALTGRDGIAKVSANYRKPVGIWFDGMVRRESQYAWLITPECASEWLGYLSAHELRTRDEMQELWTEWTASRQTELDVVILLTAFPKREPISSDEISYADRWDLEKLRTALWLDGAECPLIEAHLFERLSGANERISRNYPFGEAAGMFFEPPDRAGLDRNYVPLGPYYGAVWVARFDVRNAPRDWDLAHLSFLSRGLRTDTVFPRHR